MNFNEKPISGRTGFRCSYFQKTTGFASGFLLIFPAKSRFSLFDVPQNLLLAGDIWGLKAGEACLQTRELQRKTHLRPHGFSLPLLSKNRWLCQWFFADISGKK
jgi:hypothetical protein